MDATYSWLVWLLPAAASWPGWAVAALCATLPALACFGFVSAGPVVYVYAERIAPKSAYLLFDAQPAMMRPTVDTAEIALT